MIDTSSGGSVVAMETVAEGDELFEDAEFPTDDSALFSDNTSPLSGLLGAVTWLRPQEICNPPKLFADSPIEGYARQGILGDCWFLCACTILLRNQHLMNKVIPPGQAQWGEMGYRGVFVLRFWQCGRWTEVRVDDRLPCINNKLCFSQCQSPSAFWVALLEKAYAKLHGSYERLWAGQVCEALVDLSGGLAERWSLKASVQQPGDTGAASKTRGRSLNLDLLWRTLRDHCAVSCSVYGAPDGGRELGQYHALSVLEWVDVRTRSEGQVRLLRIRNPWGRRCWGGAWTESGDGWRFLEPACVSDLLSRTEEGEFWVDETEFLQEFDEVTVGYHINDKEQLQSIYTGMVLTHTSQISGRWVRGLSAGGCRNSSCYETNPKFWLRVSDDGGEVLISLLQCKQLGQPGNSTGRSDPNRPRPSPNHAIALHLWRVERKHVNLGRTLNKPPSASTHCHAYEREVVLHTHLSHGYYLLIPSTFQQGAEASFLLRTHSSCPSHLSAVRASVALFPLVTDGEWNACHSHGCWTPGVSAGGSRNFPSHGQNPQIPFTVTYDPGGNNIRVTLRQDGLETALHAIGFHVYEVCDAKPERVCTSSVLEPVASCVPHSYSQEVSLDCRLPPGHYIIIPSTYEPHRSGAFSLTLKHRINRKVMKSQERLGRAIQEVSHISVMHS